MLYPDSAMTQWVDLALEIVGNELVVHYGNIDGLVLCDTDGSADYRKSGFRRDNEARFDISKCISENIQDEGHNREYSVLPKNLPTPLIEILYGKNFSGMPESLQSYIMEQFCFIPRGEGIYPLSLTASTEVVPRLGYSAYAASRGVRLK